MLALSLMDGAFVMSWPVTTSGGGPLSCPESARAIRMELRHVCCVREFEGDAPLAGSVRRCPARAGGVPSVPVARRRVPRRRAGRSCRCASTCPRVWARSPSTWRPRARRVEADEVVARRCTTSGRRRSAAPGWRRRPDPGLPVGRHRRARCDADRRRPAVVLHVPQRRVLPAGGNRRSPPSPALLEAERVGLGLPMVGGEPRGRRGSGTRPRPDLAPSPDGP